MEQIIRNEIRKIVNDFKQLPYLFIGTGFSMRYSTAPAWNKLLMDTWMIINEKDETKYKRFLKKVSYNLGLDNKPLDDEEKKYYLNPELATQIRVQFNDKFYLDDEFEKLIFTEEELKELYEKDYDPFKLYIAKQTRKLAIDEGRKEFNEIKHLKNNQNKIAGVITTNYDDILENIFSDFDVLIGQNNMLIANVNNLFEIFKIHGCSTEPRSIVITQEDYNYFENKLKYLSAKLLTLFVEHPIVFIGYGVGDLNIRGILKEISECLNTDQLEMLKRNLIFINPAFGTSEGISSKEIDFGDKRITMTEITLEDYSTFYQELGGIKSSMSIKVMRKMQDMFCRFIATTEATNNIMVNINSKSVADEKLGIYFGDLDVIADMGFDYYGIEDIIQDVLFDDKPSLMNIQLIEKTFNRIRSIAGKTYLPIYKYINGLNYDISKIPGYWHIIRELKDIKLTTSEKKYTENEKKFNCIYDIQSEFPEHIPKQLANVLANIQNISDEDLGEYLREKYNEPIYMKKYASTMKKLVAAYDFIIYNSEK